VDGTAISSSFAIGVQSGNGVVTITYANPVVPSAPPTPSAAAGIRNATVTWTASDVEGYPTARYTATATPGGASCTTPTGSVTSCDVTGLANGTSYTFRVTATNVVGTSSPSAPSNAVETPRVPGAPKAPSVIAQFGKATVSWTAPGDDGGYPITSYTVSAKPGGRSCTTHAASASSCNVTGLTDGGKYTFRVTATSAVGTSLPSTSVSTEVLAAPIAVQISPFAFKSAYVSSTLKTEINLLAQLIKQSESGGYKTVVLIGHTDPGIELAEQASLSLQRAQAVEQYLDAELTSLGVTDITISARGSGAVTKSQNEGQARNRRVDVTLS
jgi:outer membrane protein OmpA-like peptidoglycan-associated protein